MKIRRSIQEDHLVNMELDQKLAPNEDKNNLKKSDIQNYFSDREIQQSQYNLSQNIVPMNKLNPISSLLFDQNGPKLKQNQLPFTDREDRSQQYGSLKNTLKGNDEEDEGGNVGTGSILNKKSNQNNAQKTILTFQKKSPIQSQITSYTHIQAGDIQLNSDIENIKSLNNIIPNFSIQEQYYNLKIPLVSNNNGSQFKQKSFQHFKNSTSDMFSSQTTKSYQNLLHSPDIQERKQNHQHSHQKFFHIKQQSQDQGFYKNYSSVKLSAQNLDGYSGNAQLINNQIKKRQDYRSINDKKEEKLNILVILNQINALYEKEGKISYNLCILVQKLISKLSKQDNMYGDQMKLFFDIIQQMIICEDETVINRIKQSKLLKKKKISISSIPAYFQCVQILSEEIDHIATHYEQVIQQIKEEKDKIIEENFSLRDKIQVSQTEFVKNAQNIEKNYQNKLNESRKKIEQQISEQEEYIKEVNGLKEQIRQAKQETEKQLRNNNNLNYILQQNQQKINELNELINSHQTQLQQKDQEIVNCNYQFEQHQSILGQFTPRPKFDAFFNMFEQVSDFSISFALDQKGLSTQDKIDYIQYMVQEKIVNNQLVKDDDKKKSQAKIKQLSSKAKQKASIIKDNQNTPPKSRNPNRKPSNLKQSNSINISSNNSSQANIKNLKEIFIKAVKEVQKRLKLKKQQIKQGIPGSEYQDILSSPSSNSNSISNMYLSNRAEQKLSNFSKSMRQITRKVSNGLQIQRSNSRATLQSMDSLDALGRDSKLKRSENLSQPSIFDQISNIGYDEQQLTQSNFKRGNKGRSSTIVQKKRTTIIEENR